VSTDKHSPRIYTKTGDKGKTSLVGGTRVSKSDSRLEAYGTVDELNCLVGLLICEISDLSQHRPSETAPSVAHEFTILGTELTAIQNQLFDVGSRLACEDPGFLQHLPMIGEDKIQNLEASMDRFTLQLTPLKNFILPGGTKAAAQAHLARTVCRRAERHCVALSESTAAAAYGQPPASGVINDGESTFSNEENVIRFLNRLSDYFFVLARFINHLLNTNEPIWKPKKNN
jgi:cob(I)alamin adenosyltransferase